MSVPALCLLELRFRCLAPIRGLGHFHGPQWSALFRRLLRPALGGRTLTEAGVRVQPFETGLHSYLPEEPLHLCLTFPAETLPQVEKLLAAFNEQAGQNGPLAPGRTIRLEEIYCRVGRRVCDAASLSRDVTPLREGHLTGEIETLRSLGGFHLVLPVPLRLTRPPKMKTLGHRYADEDFFLGDQAGSALAMDHFLAGIRQTSVSHSLTTPPSSGLTVAGGALIWVDIPYLNVEEALGKTLGGVCGRLRVSGNPDPVAARRLVIGQYTGVGKNPAFGLGYYWIPELDDVRVVAAPRRGRTHLDRCLAPENLETALLHCQDSSPGPDGLTFTDLKKSGRDFLERLAASVREGNYAAGGGKRYRLPKAAGGFREIRVQNVADRLLQRAAAEHLQPVVDRFLSQSSWAYRAGLNRKGAAEALKAALGAGFRSGVKADIAAFFDTVDLSLLEDLLSGLFPFDPLPAELISWLRGANGGDGVGLPQGSPLSPVLSNLFLHRFDRDMEREGFRLIRYADDFVVLFPDRDRDGGLDAVTASLYRLGLTLKEEKTLPVVPGRPVRFLGYSVTSDAVDEDISPPEDDTEPWLPIFRQEWAAGTPVYLTAVCRGAYSSGAHLVIKDEKGRMQNIPWNRIGRLVVVGRSPFSGGVIYRAMREEIPVSFVDIMGRATGRLHPAGCEEPDLAALQEEKAKDEGFRLAFSREIIAAKIQNGVVLLRRNGIDAGELKEMARKAREADKLDSLRGYEGTAARIYFSHLAGLVKPFEFRGRVYHPPDGPVNVMLSFGYTLLYNRIAAVLRDRGFNPRRGFFHQGRGGHLALASDLLEELRHIAERVVLALIHRREIKPGDFTIVRRGDKECCRMEGEGFRSFIRRYETTMATPFKVEEGKRMSVNAYLDEMADRLRRCLKLDVPYRALRID
ncbi:MAG TPA: CRISPR-associated endonuclease Cas1 [Syntrophales bacterium]|nr:CRISPR-associated endonuclease Cas1 [Syntrophales bacterium]HOM08153.1 CRISPR-associated endonuclease Cas1 [Syntrophales bacterium]